MWLVFFLALSAGKGAFRGADWENSVKTGKKTQKKGMSLRNRM